MTATVICPYLFENEVVNLKAKLGWDVECIFQQDHAMLGPDLMYQKLWNLTTEDVIIIHSDMMPLTSDTENTWYQELCHYADRYPEAGMFGCLLLYPKRKEDKDYYIQSAGGHFSKRQEIVFPQHYGSGLELFSGQTFDTLEIDKGQYNSVREVAWTTFGGLYIRREVLNKIGNFDPSFEWSYNRDVDYCLQTRKEGYKIYQVPVRLLHFESKDVKRLRAQNSELNNKEARNLQRLNKKWVGSELFETIERTIDDN